MFLFIKKYKWPFASLAMLVTFVLAFIILNLIFPLRINTSYSTLIYGAEGNVIHAYLANDDKWRMKVELNEIIPDLRKAFIEKEDKYFYTHPGVNPLAIGRAFFNNFSKGRKTSGASTITMQVARLLEPQKRTYLNKFIEIFRALQLELAFSKEEILQMYLNLVPYGSNIEGVKSASILYFGTTPDKLSLAQITALAIIPNRPTSLRIGKSNELIRQERNKWLLRFKADNVFSAEDIADALEEPLNDKRKKSPSFAPHFCRRVKKENPDGINLMTTLKSFSQQKVQQLTYNYIQRTKNRNINNAAVVIINNSTMEIEAYLGSPDFFDTENGGQVDGVKAIRSPGSTLKPFVYALGFDKGLITPKSMLLDVPTDFEGYQPENFDKKFNGKVSVETALAYSLNVPAVKVLEQMTVPVFLEQLKKAGFKQIKKDEKNLGYSVILGGCGVSLEELTALFSGFANEGKLVTPAFMAGKSDKKNSVSIVSPAAAYMCTDILTQMTRPDLPNNYQSSYHVPKIAWKTGTSYGRKDAWSIGYNKKYTIGVWVGNFSGKGVPELTGADLATPLLFEIFNSMDYNSENLWFKKPSGLSFRFVCSESGSVPGNECTNEVVDYFIPKISSAAKCEHMKYVFLSADEKYSYCTSCLPENGFKRKLYPDLEPELTEFYKTHHISFVQIPVHNPQCERVFSDKAPKILSPADGKEYYVSKDDPEDIMLRCVTESDVRKVYWYVNNKFFKEALPNEKLFIKPVRGNSKISCSDDKGRNTNAVINVNYY